VIADVEALTGERLAPPGPGRVYSERRTVALADVGPDGLIRFDAAARYLQDVATGDVRSAGVEEAVAWVVRRTTIVMIEPLRYAEPAEVSTWCSGTGASLAERRTTIRGAAGGAVEAVSLWVSLDRRTLRPVAVEDRWFAAYRESAGDRRVRARFLVPVDAFPGGPRRPWPLRAADIDLMRHVNNAVSWSAVEEAAGRAAAWGQVEYRRPLDLDDDVSVTTAGDETGARVVLWAGGEAASAARIGYRL
jgi:acyl-ACP thioesterase